MKSFALKLCTAALLGIISSLNLTATESDSAPAPDPAHSAQLGILNLIKERGEIRMGVPPKGRRDEYIEMANVFAKHLGVKAKVVVLDSFDQHFHNEQGVTVKGGDYTPQKLKTGEVDFYPGDIFINDWRGKMIDIIPFYQSQMLVVIPKARAAEFKSEKDLQGKTVSVMKGTTYHSWVEDKNKEFKDNPIKIKFVENLADRTNLSGEVDFTIEAADVFFSETVKKRLDLQSAFPVGPILNIGWGFRREDKDLQQAAKEFFKLQLQKEGSEFDQIWEKRGIKLSDFTLMMSNIIKQQQKTE